MIICKLEGIRQKDCYLIYLLIYGLFKNAVSSSDYSVENKISE